jgi:hypothetical protein
VKSKLIGYLYHASVKAAGEAKKLSNKPITSQMNKQTMAKMFEDPTVGVVFYSTKTVSISWFLPSKQSIVFYTGLYRYTVQTNCYWILRATCAKVDMHLSRRYTCHYILG